MGITAIQSLFCNTFVVQKTIKRQSRYATVKIVRVSLIFFFCKMDEPWRYANKFLFKSASANIYSSPPFVMEAILSFAICCVYIFLHFDLYYISKKTIRLKQDYVYMSRRIRQLASNSQSSSVVHLFNVSDTNVAEMSREKDSISFVMDETLKNAKNSVEDKIDNVLKLTPEEYLRQQKQLHSKNEFHACLKSLSSLYEDCIKGEKSDTELQKQLQMAKDSLGEDAVRYLGKNAQYLTQSLFDLLEKMVMSSSLENPLPFKGDFTTLVFDAGNLNVEEDVERNKQT